MKLERPCPRRRRGGIRLVHDLAELRGRGKFCDIALCAEIKRIAQIVRLLRGGKHDDRDLIERALAANPAQDVEAGHARHPHIEKTGDGRRRAPQHADQCIDQLFARGKLLAGMIHARLGEQPLKEHPVDLFVVDHEDRPCRLPALGFFGNAHGVMGGGKCYVFGGGLAWCC